MKKQQEPRRLSIPNDTVRALVEVDLPPVRGGATTRCDSCGNRLSTCPV